MYKRKHIRLCFVEHWKINKNKSKENYGTPLLPYSIVYLECLAKILLRYVTWSIQGMQLSLCYVKSR